MSPTLKQCEANSTAIAANNQANNAAIAANRASVEGLVQVIAEFSARTEANLTRLNQAITGINTTNSRLERILEQLLRHDQNGNGDQPQG